MTEVVVIFGNFTVKSLWNVPVRIHIPASFVFVFCGLQLLESTQTTLPGTFVFVCVCVGGKEPSP